MSPGLMAIVLLAALLHAVWNVLVRASEDKMRDAALVVGGAGLWMCAWIPFAPVPAVESWPYLVASALIHVVYFSLVGLCYRDGEMSLVYPVMRGTAPVFSCLVVALLLEEDISPEGWAGVLLVSGGVLLLAREGAGSTGAPGRALRLALINAGVIVLYTLVDGVGARASGCALSYTGWVFLLTALPMLSGLALLNGPEILRTMLDKWPRALFGGACTFGSYGLALWAMTLSPIALVAALRETSVVFGGLMAVLFLRERVRPLRVLSLALVLAGAVLIRLA